MKKFVYLLFVILPLSFLSCSSDDDSATSAEIVGKWMNTEIRMEGEFIIPDIGTATITGIATDNDAENYTIFHADKTLETHPKPMEMTFKIRFMGMEETYVQEVNVDMPQFGQWKQQGDRLTITAEEETWDFTIDTLTDSTLKISTENMYMNLPLEDGIELPEAESFKMSIVFSRL